MLPLVLMLAAAPADDPPKAKLPIGKDTTVVEGPLDKDGYIDYEAALNARLSKGVTPETNACVLIWQALGPTPEGYELPPVFYERLGVKPPAGGAYFRMLEPFMTARGLARDDRMALESRLTRSPWTAREQPDFAAWLAANEKPLAVLAEATRRPAYYNPLVARVKDGKRTMLVGVLLPGVQQCRSLGHALAIRAMLRTGEGKYTEAWADLLTARRLARHVARGGTIELLVGYAVDAVATNATLGYLAARKPSASEAAAHVRDLDALPPMPSLAEKVDLTERFVYLDVVQHARRGEVDALDGLTGDDEKLPAGHREKLMAGIDWGFVLKEGNAAYDRIRDTLAHPTRPARQAAAAKFKDELHDRRNRATKRAVTAADAIRATIDAGGDPTPTARAAVSEGVSSVLLGLLEPAFERMQADADRNAEQLRLTKLVFALAAYKADAGAYPETLATLAPKYVKAVEPDLFTGKLLVYKRTADGYLRYSVGPNETDDGGRLSTSDPKGDDIAVRMPPAGT